MPGGGQILCSCPWEVKLPLLELECIKRKICKAGELSEIYVGGSDKVESARQEKHMKRKEQEALVEEIYKRRRDEEIQAIECQFEEVNPLKVFRIFSICNFVMII